jgi:hypothetical protein
MGLFLVHWRFGGATPSLERLAAVLRARIGTDVTVHAARREPDGRETPARLEVPGVCKGFEFDLFFEEGGVRVECGITTHPYLLPQLEAALEELGGTRDPPHARAAPRDERVLRPWAELPWSARLLLGRPSLWMLWDRGMKIGTRAGGGAARTAIVVLDLPVPGSGCGDVCVTYRGLDVQVEYEYRAESADRIGVLVFRRASAFRFADELHAPGFVGQSYDAVVEIDGSAWVAELRAREPSGISGVQGKRHFAVFLSSNGYLEVVAESVSEGEPREGLLEAR